MTLNDEDREAVLASVQTVVHLGTALLRRLESAGVARVPVLRALEGMLDPLETAIGRVDPEDSGFAGS